MRDKLERRINLLTIYAVVSTLALGTLVFTSFKNKENNILTDELTVKRINLIGEDGSLRMVISNEKRQHPGRINGKNLAPRERPAGILFFNNQGDECGGLVYNVAKEKNSTNSGMSFTMDNYHNDQVVQILNDETYNGGNSSDIQRGIMVNEFPEGADFNATNDKYQAILKINAPVLTIRIGLVLEDFDRAEQRTQFGFDMPLLAKVADRAFASSVGVGLPQQQQRRDESKPGGGADNATPLQFRRRHHDDGDAEQRQHGGDDQYRIVVAHKGYQPEGGDQHTGNGTQGADEKNLSCAAIATMARRAALMDAYGHQ